MAIAPALKERLRSRLTFLYGDRADRCLQGILEQVREHGVPPAADPRPAWSERDVVLISYPDQIRGEDEPPLRVLDRFLTSTELHHLVSHLHILPFFPYSSDDGFSVIDYRTVDPAVGDWEDVRELGRNFSLMFDFVLNHVSSGSDWFREYLAGREPYRRFFIEVPRGTDLSAVVRPRSHPLLTPFETARGERDLWTTFSADQIDLDYAEPEVLLAMTDVLLFYLRKGARIVRLDAIAYLWKEIGTSCIHLPRTHEVVKLFRDLLDAVSPGVLLLTETNVPHDENVSYFGAGDEAHLVYPFSLPPLLLDAYLEEDAVPFMGWLGSLGATPAGTTYFNFTASHDGIGVRPLEGLLPPERIEALVDAVRARGGLVSSRRGPGGADSPYELNITYLDALGDPAGLPPRLHVRRFLASQALMLAMRGIPGIYFHSLVGTSNDLRAVEETGQARRINRRKLSMADLAGSLSSGESIPAAVFDGYRRLLSVRVAQPAFHPAGGQEAWETPHRSVIAFLRSDPEGRQRILVVANLARCEQEVELSARGSLTFRRDLLGGPLSSPTSMRLEPFQVAWLEADGQ